MSVASELQKHLDSLSRQPFRDALADLLHCKPTKEALQEFANKSPDRYWQAVTLAGKLSGYNDTIKVEHNFYMAIQTLPDNALDAKLEQLEQQLRQITGKDSAIDAIPSLPSPEGIESEPNS